MMLNTKQFIKKKRKEGEPLLEKDIQEWDFYLFNNDFFVSSEWLDGEKAVAWGTYLGMLLGDFEAIICNYSNKTGRKYFFAYNNFGQPTCFFDVETKEELYDMWSKESKQMTQLHGIEEGHQQTKVFMSPKKKEE
jgi:hypothetical protein